MTEVERKKFFAVQQDEVVVEGTAQQTEPETKPVYEEEVDDFERDEVARNKKGNLLQQVFSSVKNWFEVDNVNGDFTNYKY